MSLYRYKVVIRGGGVKQGLITAKTEVAAREQVARKFSVVEWWSLQEEAAPAALNPAVVSPAAPGPVVPPPAAPRPKARTKLERLLFIQHGRCFFCGEPLRAEEASIEHLLPLSRGGKRTDENEVVCHRTLNETFGNMELKRKFEFVLKAAGKFQCPSADQPSGPEAGGIHP